MEGDEQKMIILQRESRYEVGDPDCVFKVNVYLRKDGEHYITSADHGIELCSGENLKQRQKLRQEIIDAFNELY